jgi:hypothetical protein
MPVSAQFVPSMKSPVSEVLPPRCPQHHHARFRLRLKRPGTKRWILITSLLQPDLSCWACRAQSRAPDVAAHGGEALATRVAHDLFIKNAIAVSRGHETGTQAVGADRLLPFAL